MSHNDPKKRKQTDNSDSEGGSSDEAPAPKKANVGMAKGVHWKQGLLAAMVDEKAKVFEDEHIVVVKDKYPKARYHFLVLPKEKIDKLEHLTEKHLPLLEKMKEAGRDVASENGLVDHFRFGFHARPSMSQLHMHVISQDFISPCLKNKHHWNSFTTDFFRNIDAILKELRENGRVTPPDAATCEAWLKQPLKCHLCEGEKIFPTIPKLKEHLLKHNNQNPQK